jgi:hemin uptake protein HemP
MTQSPQPVRSRELGGDATEPPPLVVDSAALMGGRRELIIRHGTDSYRLRITASNKLILTK